MGISDELKKLDEFRRNGVLSHDEFETAKRRILENPDITTNSAQLDDIRTQLQFVQLDQEWECERERYMVTGRRGQRYVPTKARSVIQAIAFVGFGVFWTIMTRTTVGFGQVESLSPFPVFGMLIVLVGVGMPLHSFIVASRYEGASAVSGTPGCDRPRSIRISVEALQPRSFCSRRCMF